MSSTKSPVLVQQILSYGALPACDLVVVRSQSPILRQNCSIHTAARQKFHEFGKEGDFGVGKKVQGVVIQRKGKRWKVGEDFKITSQVSSTSGNDDFVYK